MRDFAINSSIYLEINFKILRRFRDVSSPVANPTSKRYVITAPTHDFPLVRHALNLLFLFLFSQP